MTHHYAQAIVIMQFIDIVVKKSPQVLSFQHQFQVIQLEGQPDFRSTEARIHSGFLHGGWINNYLRLTGPPIVGYICYCLVFTVSIYS